MARVLHEYDPPERFVAGTVGEPGQRTFFLQASGGGRTTSVSLEKQQVFVLAERVQALLDEVARRATGEPGEPGEGAAAGITVAPAVEDNAPLETPIEEEFRVGTMALAWDPDDEVVVIEAQAVTDEDGDEEGPLIDEDDADGPPLLRVRLPGPLARGFAARAQVVVAAGRPPCPFCGGPLDAAGHVCPRANGYRR